MPRLPSRVLHGMPNERLLVTRQLSSELYITENVCISCVSFFLNHNTVPSATHTGSGGPCEATNRHADTDYFYQVQMNDEGKVVR